MAINVALHFSGRLGLIHVCQCTYCDSVSSLHGKSPGRCSDDEDSCTSDFTSLTTAEKITHGDKLV